MFIVADRLSQLVAKGEITAGYYNPGDFFDEVHLLTTTNDRVDPASLQATAGSARLFVHSLWTGSDLLNTMLTPLLEREWVRRATRLASRIQPDLIRSGDRLTGYLGARIRQRLRIPHIVSLHSHRDDQCARLSWGPHRVLLEFEKRYHRFALSAADAVVIVYQSLMDYAVTYGARRIECIYNVISPQSRQPKQHYGLSTPAKIISVGRQIPGKVPDQLILAMKQVDGHLHLVGDGPAHPYLRSLVHEHGLEDRVEFTSTLENEQLCAQLPDYDLFAVHSNYPGIPKAIMEALWLGLPVVVNEDQSAAVPEFEGQWLMRVNNGADGYAHGLNALLQDDDGRRRLGREGRAYAVATFDPQVMEQRMVELYGELVGGR